MALDAGRAQRRSLIALFAALLTIVIAVPNAEATVVSLKTFKTSIDVRLNITEHSIWNGIRAGCYAPQENFEIRYHLSTDSTPNRKSKIRSGTATLTGGSFGVTPSYGDRSSFEQFSTPGQWTLESQYSGDCGPDPAPPVPAWATSPTCKNIKERTSAWLAQNSVSDSRDLSSSVSRDDGVLIVTRTPRARPAANGASIGDSCFRTLHSVSPMGADSSVEIGLKNTYISVPVPDLQSKLSRLARGSRNSRPSFRVPIKISGNCNAMQMKPYNGPSDNFVATPFSQPHNALGSFNGEAEKSVCTIAGSGVAVVRRVGGVVNTGAVLK